MEFPQGHIYEDVATIHRVISNAPVISFAPKPLYHYRMRENSIVRDRSMQSLVDYWRAHYQRYLYFMTSPDNLDTLEDNVANAIAKAWRWVYGIPKEQRSYTQLQKMSFFARNKYPLLGKKNWKLSLRICIFFARYMNEASFAVLFIMSAFFRIISNKNKTRMLFP